MNTREVRQIVKTWQGADGRVLQFQAVDAQGNAYDLSDLTVTLTANFSGVTMIEAAECSVTDAAGGLFEYQPSAEQIADAGDYDAQVMLENTGGEFDFLEIFTLRVQEVVAVIAVE